MHNRIYLSDKDVFSRKGNFHNIYSIGEDKIAKFPTIHRGLFWRLNLYGEYKFQKDLYDSGISVPTPYGLIRVNAEGRNSLGILMEKI